MSVYVDQTRHDKELAVVKHAAIHGNRGSIGGVADEGDGAVVADAHRDVVADRADVSGEEGATADMDGHDASSCLGPGRARCSVGAPGCWFQKWWHIPGASANRRGLWHSRGV